ncbi:MAG: hypothetical protein WKF87_14085 [Chryseolinea sp.]
MKPKINSLNFSFLIVIGLIACGKSGTNKSDIKETEQASLAVETSTKPVQAKKTIRFNFDNYEIDQLPKGWSQAYTGSGGTDWNVIEEKGNKVFAQLYSDNPNKHFNIATNDSIEAKNMILTVRLKGVKGNEDQGGGFVWRFKDKENYYIVRANPLEDNIVLYKVEDGKRTDLPLVDKGKTYGMKVQSMGNAWHTLKLSVNDNMFTVYFDDQEVFKVQDNTFTNAGKVGFWTKADAVTYFDDFEIAVLE